MRNEFYIQRWMSEHDIDEGPLWRKEIVEARDPLGLFTDQPQVEKVHELRDDLGLSPLFYYCFVAKKEQLARLFEIIPAVCWEPHIESNRYHIFHERTNKSPLNYVALGGKLDTIQYMISCLDLYSDLSLKISKPFERIASDGYDYSSLLFCLALGGHLPVVQWLFSNEFPVELGIISGAETKDLVTTIFLNADLPLVQWALSDHFPDQMKQHLQTAQVLANAVSSANVSVIQWIFSDNLPNHYKPLFKAYKNDKEFRPYPRFSDPKMICMAGATFFDFSMERILAQSDFQTMQWLLGKESPLKLKQFVIEKNLFCDYYLNDRLFKNSTANPADDFKEMLMCRDEYGNTFLHKVTKGYLNRPDCIAVGNRKMFQDFIVYQPELAAAMWDVANKNGDTIDLGTVGFFNQPITRITSIKLLKQILHAALMRNINNHLQITANDLRLLRAFKDKVIRYIKDPAFIDTTMVMQHFNSGLFEFLYGQLTDINLKIIFKLLEYENRTQLNATLLNELIDDLSPKQKTPSKCGLFCQPKINSFEKIIDCLRKIAGALNRNILNSLLSSDDIKKSAIVLKLILNDRDLEESFCEDDRYLLIAIRNVLLRTEEISVLMPKVAVSDGDAMLDSEFAELLNNIEAEIKLVVGSEHVESALMVLNGIRYLSTHFDELNAFSKAYPNKLYYLDNPAQNCEAFCGGKLPFHIDQYDTDDALRDTLSRTVREYIAAFHLAKAAGQSKAFFEKTTNGFCLDGRMRDTVTWVVQFSGVETLDALMEKYIAEYVAYQSIINQLPMESALKIETALEFIMCHHEDELYQYEKTLLDDEGNLRVDEKGSPKKETTVEPISESVVEDYLTHVLCFERLEKQVKSGCCVLM